MLICACVLPNTQCWLLSTGILRLICFITSTRNLLNRHLLTAPVQEAQHEQCPQNWTLEPALREQVGSFSRAFLGCVLLPLRSSVSVFCGQTPRSARVTWGSARQDMRASKSKSCETLPGTNCCLWGSKGSSAFHVHVTDYCSKLPDKEVSAVWELLLLIIKAWKGLSYEIIK